MERNEVKALNQAFANSVLAGGASVAGIVQLCAELVDAGVLAPAAAHRVKTAMVNDINGTSAAEWQARNQLVRAIDHIFGRIPGEAEQPPE